MAKSSPKSIQTIDIAAETRVWLQALAENGLLVTVRGKPAAHPDVKKLVEALHTVLAGGLVTVKVARRGDPKLKKALDAMLLKAMKASAKAGRSTPVLFP